MESINQNAIVCQNVSIQIKKKQILNDVSFTVKSGKIAGLLGPNGAGKSTLLKVLSGLTPPLSGAVHLMGQPAGVETLKNLSFLPDRGKLPGWLTSREWLQFASEIYPDWNQEQTPYLIEALKVKLDTRISALSRGEEARLQLMTCLTRQAPIVILDEPFTGVDLISREQIASTIVNELSSGRTFLIATHDIREMENLFEQIILINNGKIVSDDEVDLLREKGHSVESRYREVFA